MRCGERVWAAGETVDPVQRIQPLVETFADGRWQVVDVQGEVGSNWATFQHQRPR